MNTSKSWVTILLLLITPFVIFSHNESNPKKTKYFISPGISFGYTFQGAPNIALSMDVGVLDRNNAKTQYGINYTVRYMKFRKANHRTSSLSMMYQNQLVDVKLGLATIRARSGYNNIRNCFVSGLMADVSFHLQKEAHTPKVGYTALFYKRRRWGYFPTYYHGPYVGYEYFYESRS